jgi:hypothetical protein
MLSVLEALGLILSTGKTKQESKLALLGFFFFFFPRSMPSLVVLRAKGCDSRAFGLQHV